ncbi:MAG TPA: TonB family protein [Bryobacteraceae bacterium]
MERSWQSYIVSGLAHVCAAALLVALTVPVVKRTERPSRSVALIAPVLPQRISPPRFQPQHEVKLPVIPTRPAPAALPKFVPPPAAVKPVSRSANVIPEAPKAITLDVPQHAAPPLTAELPVAPKAEVHTGAFDQSAATVTSATRRTVSVGAFGEESGAPGGGGGRGGGPVQLGGFGDQTAVNRAKQPGHPETSTYTPVEILFKPKPVYTKDARDARVEGEVSLEVVFLASGEIRVGRVLRGLGHGLDEAAQQAAALVRFKPAIRGGVPVDTPATIRITFALT